MEHLATKPGKTPSIRRLPVYLRFLKELRKQNENVVSCTRIAEELGQLSVQVRKDISLTCATGRPRIGYDINELIDAIEDFLGWNTKTNAVLVGAGSLGSAILGYEGFVEHGLDVLAAFDTDKRKIGTQIHHCRVESLDNLLEFSKTNNIQIGILTVPASAAQDVCNLVLKTGVQGIWNFTPVRLEVPEHIIREDVQLSASFAVLSNRLMKQKIEHRERQK
ncbi:MAG: redox-sensing transcriptional repressor Rex [Planctomycetaceae bacterium]|nr:redox-sensing transcriptional repressor Rex [Planctomycetaceae bacterium]